MPRHRGAEAPESLNGPVLGDRGGVVAPATPGAVRRPELDGLRGLAILAVLASHARVPGFPQEAGHGGVILFFVLSGYLIVGILVTELQRTGTIDVGAFYLRRALRLFPALAIIVIVVAIGESARLWAAAGHVAPAGFAAVVLYVGNWYIALGNGLGPLGHTWSLAIEEQFYLVTPLLLLAALRVLRRRQVALGLVIIAVLITPWRLLIAHAVEYDRLRFGLDTNADGLLVGAAIALGRVEMSRMAGALGAFVLLATAVLWPSGPLGMELAAPAATIASATAVAGCPRVLGWAPLAFVGRISYGLYLWHYLLVWDALAWPVTIGASFALAIVSYVVIESPFLRLKDRISAGRANGPRGAAP